MWTVLGDVAWLTLMILGDLCVRDCAGECPCPWRRHAEVSGDEVSRCPTSF